MSSQDGVRCRRGALQFMPYTFEMWDWAEFSSPKRLLQALVLVVMVLAFELNAFFLKTLFWIPPPHPINILRLLLLWGIGLPGIKEYHSFLEVCSQADTSHNPYESIERMNYDALCHRGTLEMSSTSWGPMHGWQLPYWQEKF